MQIRVQFGNSKLNVHYHEMDRLAFSIYCKSSTQH